jgi:hypothetical protein
MSAVGDCPNRVDGFSIYVKRNEQSFFGKRRRSAQVRITAFPMSEQHRNVAVEHITAGAKIARGASAEVGRQAPAIAA